MTIRRSDRRALSFVLVAALATAPLGASIAHADASKEDVATAKSALKEGRKLREAGDLAGALVKLKAAYALVPTPITGWEVGKTEEMLGQLLEARDTLLEVVSMPVSPKEVAEHKKARADADALAASIKARIPELTIVVRGNVAEGFTRVRIDGREVPMAALGVAQKLDPGAHTVTATTNGVEATAKVTLKESESTSVTLDVPQATAATMSSSGDGAAPAKATRSTWSSQKTMAVVVAGTGLVALGVGTALGFSAKSKWNDSAPFCQGNFCSDEGLSIRDDARSKATVATIVFGVGAAAIVGGVVLWFTAPKRGGGDVNVGVAVSPSSFALTGRF